MMMNLSRIQHTSGPAPAGSQQVVAFNGEAFKGLTPVKSPGARVVCHSGKMNFCNEKNKSISFVEPQHISGEFSSTRLKFDTLESQAFQGQEQLKALLDDIYTDFDAYLNCDKLPVDVWNHFKDEVHEVMQQFISNNINALLGTEGFRVTSVRSVVPPTFREAGSGKSGVSPVAHVDNALVFQPLIRLNSHGIKNRPANKAQFLELNFWFPLGKYSKNLLAVKDMSHFKRNEIQARKFTRMINTTNMLGRIKWRVNPLRVAKTAALDRGTFVCPKRSQLYDFTMFDTSQSLHGPVVDPSTYSPEYDEGNRRSMELRYALQLSQPLEKGVSNQKV